MISESSPWKCDLLRMKQEIIQYNNSKYFNDDSSDAITIIEQAIFYSAFVIRKLIDCKTKVSDKVDKYTFKLKSIPPKNKINFLSDITNSYNWDNSRAIGQKVLMTNPNKPDSYLNDVARSIQLHLPT